MVAQGEKGREEKACKLGISRCELLHTGWMNNKVLLYSTGDYVQYPLTNRNEKEYGKIYKCITESACCTQEINIVNLPYFIKNFFNVLGD